MAWLFRWQRYGTHRATNCWNVCEANLRSERSWYAQCIQPYTCRRYCWRMWETEQFWGTIDFHSIFFPTMEDNGAPKPPGFKIILCSAEQRNSYKFGMTWGWVNDDRINFFWWTIPLSRWGIFVAIAKNTLYGSNLSIFLLNQKSLGY